MTANRNFKRRVRTRVAKTGESYTTALRRFRPTPPGDVMPETHDCVLTSTTGGVPHDKVGANEVQGHAAANSYWVSFAVPAQHSTTAPQA